MRTTSKFHNSNSNNDGNLLRTDTTPTTATTVDSNVEVDEANGGGGNNNPSSMAVAFDGKSLFWRQATASLAAADAGVSICSPRLTCAVPSTATNNNQQQACCFFDHNHQRYCGGRLDADSASFDTKSWTVGFRLESVGFIHVFSGNQWKEIFFFNLYFHHFLKFHFQ